MKSEEMINEQIKIYYNQLHKHMKTCEKKDCHLEDKLEVWCHALKWVLKD